VFFSYNKSVSAKISQPKTIQRTGWMSIKTMMLSALEVPLPVYIAVFNFFSLGHVTWAPPHRLCHVWACCAFEVLLTPAWMVLLLPTASEHWRLQMAGLRSDGRLRSWEWFDYRTPHSYTCC
jgi:hypothetical protein